VKLLLLIIFGTFQRLTVSKDSKMSVFTQAYEYAASNPDKLLSALKSSAASDGSPQHWLGGSAVRSDERAIAGGFYIINNSF